MFNLYIKAEITNGVTIPKGRVNLPREAKAMTEDKILVFAEGRQAEEAKKAGAHIVGGPELIDGVCSIPSAVSQLNLNPSHDARLSTVAIKPRLFSVLPL